MEYSPWPENGCALAEARDRTSDRLVWTYWRDRDDRPKPHREASREGTPPLARNDEDGTEAEFRQRMMSSRLVAYGRPGHPDAAPRLISRDIWLTLPKVDWEGSSIGEDRRAGNVFFTVRVFPALLAPCRLDLLDRCPLSDAFKKFILEDPEVAALAAVAVRLSPEFERVFIRGRCHVHGVEEWPVAYERWCTIGTVHPDPAKRSKFDVPRNPDPIEVIIAADALTHRYRTLISMLRRGELQGYGLAVSPAHPCEILHSIWSHEEFHLDAASGDVLQVNPKSRGRHDYLTKRWIGVVLQRTTAVSEEIPIFDSRKLNLQATPQTEAETRGSADNPPFTIADVVRVGSLSAALTHLVFRHPRVQTLRAAAMQVAKTSRVACEEDAGLVGLVFGHGEPLLPLRYFSPDECDFSSLPLEPPTPEEVAIDETFFGGGPPEIDAYYSAVNLHALTLIGKLQNREVIGLGHTAQGDLVPIAHSIWSHEDFYVHPPTGDVFEAGYGDMTKKWTGVILVGPNDSLSGSTFHVKGTASDGVPSTTTDHQNRPPKPRKALARVETSSASHRECVAWISQIMRASPKERTETRKGLWDRARGKWPNTLSERSFVNAWAEAIRTTGAIAWSAAGAPKKSPRRKLPR